MKEKRQERSLPARRPRRGSVESVTDMQSLDFGRKNWILLGAGGASVALGFLLLKLGDITLAPILLVGGYLVLIPWGLVARPRVEPSKTETDTLNSDQGV